MNNKTTLVVTAMPNPAETESMQAYFKGVLPLLMSAGGQIIKRQKVRTSLSGPPTFGMVLVMDFPSTETVEALFASDEYAALIPVRDRGFSSLSIALTQDL